MPVHTHDMQAQRVPTLRPIGEVVSGWQHMTVYTHTKNVEIDSQICNERHDSADDKVTVHEIAKAVRYGMQTGASKEEASQHRS